MPNPLLTVATLPNAMTTAEPRVNILASFSPTAMLESNSFMQFLINEVARQIATRYVAENYASIVAKLTPEAVANLAIASAGRMIAEEIRMRPVEHTPSRTVVNNYVKRSIF